MDILSCVIFFEPPLSVKYKEGSVLIKDIQRRFFQGLEVYSIMTAAVSTMTATLSN